MAEDQEKDRISMVGKTQNRHAKEKGAWALLKAQCELIKHDFMVSVPIGDKDKYDLITDYRGVLNRVQVKSIHTLYQSKTGGDRYTTKAGYGSKHKTLYTGNEIDFIVCYVVPEDIWYVIPICGIKSITIALFPHRNDYDGGYECYKEAWDLLKQMK